MQRVSPRYVRCEDIHSKKIGDQWVILKPGSEAVLELNETAGVLWDALQAPQTIRSLVKHITSIYFIDTQRATEDIQEFLSLYLQRGLLRQVAP